MGKSTVITSSKGGVRLLKRLFGRSEKEKTLQELHSLAQKIARDYCTVKFVLTKMAFAVDLPIHR
ncbi:MAG: hypothetical protein ACE5PV_06925, partial [Candidatus Poribacteria bacterium]